MKTLILEELKYWKKAYNLACSRHRKNMRAAATHSHKNVEKLSKMIESLLSTCELNLDEMEPHTIRVIEKARALLQAVRS